MSQGCTADITLRPIFIFLLNAGWLHSLKIAARVDIATTWLLEEGASHKMANQSLQIHFSSLVTASWLHDN